MGIIEYRTKNNKTLEFKNNKWYYKNREIPQATFYENGGDREKQNRFNAGKMEAEDFLIEGDDPKNVFCKFGYIYFPTKIKGKRKIIRTGRLERIENDT